MPEYDVTLPAPMCRLGACFTGNVLTRLDFLPADTPVSSQLNTQARQLARELDAYWQDPNHRFALPFVPHGTPFQLRVWQALMAIPTGQPTTYGALAKQLGTAARAVGQACGSNPLPILIPCHRVVAFPAAQRREVPVLDDNPMYVRDYSKCVLCWRCVQVCAEDAQYTFAINFSWRGFETQIGTFSTSPCPRPPASSAGSA